MNWGMSLGETFIFGLQSLCIMTQVLLLLWTFQKLQKQIEVQKNSNMMNSFANLKDRWESKKMLIARRMICSEYLEKSKKPNKKNINSNLREHVLNHFEVLGLYFNKGIFEIPEIWDEYDDTIKAYWKILEPDIIKIRKSHESDMYFERFQALFKAVHKYSKKKDPKYKRITMRDTLDSAKGEINLIDDLLNIGDIYKESLTKEPRDERGG